MSLSQNHTKAVDAVGRWITENLPGAQPLEPGELSSSPLPNTRAGWSLAPVEGCGLVLLLDGAFPYSLPRVALVDAPPAARRWPHVESDARLCLAPVESGVDPRDPVAVVQSVLTSAAALLREGKAGLNRGDYRTDFSLYWLRDSSGSIETLLDPEPPSRVIAAVFGDGRLLLAENPEDGGRWLQNRLGTQVEAAAKEAAFVWLDLLPEPQDYPSSAIELRQLVARESRDGLGVLDQVVTDEARVSYVVLAGRNRERRFLAAVSLKDKPQKVIPGRKSSAHIPGFRPGRTPPQIVALHKTTERLYVNDVNDAATRLPPEYRALKQKEVAIIGCGSLGSGIARQLAMSGVGALTLVDPDTLNWANIGRHEVGAQAVGLAKAMR